MCQYQHQLNILFLSTIGTQNKILERSGKKCQIGPLSYRNFQLFRSFSCMIKLIENVHKNVFLLTTQNNASAISQGAETKMKIVYEI